MPIKKNLSEIPKTMTGEHSIPGSQPAYQWEKISCGGSLAWSHNDPEDRHGSVYEGTPMFSC